jgi:hypothetical protein
VCWLLAVAIVVAVAVAAARSSMLDHYDSGVIFGI